jgi:hypothetical protein
MADVEDRVAALEERMDHHTAMLGDLRDDVRQLRGEVVQLGGELRGEMRQLGSHLRGEMRQLGSDLRDDMNRRFEHIDQRFAWLVGIQMGTLVAIIGGLVGVLKR